MACWVLRSVPAAACLAGALLVGACAPALDWRDIRAPGSPLLLQLPCKPSAQQRRVALAGATVSLALQACEAGGSTWGLGHADVVAPDRVGPALAALRNAAQANLGAGPGRPLPLRVAGATPNDFSGRVALQGRLPDGQPMQMQVAVFAHGTTVYQATVLGAALSDDAAQAFFESLRFAP